jgi:hypothetical protein
MIFCRHTREIRKVSTVKIQSFTKLCKLLHALKKKLALFATKSSEIILAEQVLLCKSDYCFIRSKKIKSKSKKKSKTSNYKFSLVLVEQQVRKS